MKVTNTTNSILNFIISLMNNKELNLTRLVEILSQVTDEINIIRLLAYISENQDAPFIPKEVVKKGNTLSFNHYNIVENRITYNYMKELKVKLNDEQFNELPNNNIYNSYYDIPSNIRNSNDGEHTVSIMYNSSDTCYLDEWLSYELPK